MFYFLEGELSTQIVWSSKQRTYFFSYLFIQPFIYVNMDSWMFILYFGL
jgi:hypothetical protein